MLLLFGVLLTLGIPLLALRGRGDRQLYIYAAIAALPFGGALLWLGQVAPVDPKKMSTAEMDGTMFINDYFPIVGIVLLVAGLQALVAALLRPSTPPPPTGPEWIRQ